MPLPFRPAAHLLGFLALTAPAGCASSVQPSGQTDATGAERIANVDATSATDVRAMIDTSVMAAASITCPVDSGVAFPASLTACNTASDCVAVVHGLDCCGSTEIVGINGAQRSAYAGPEMACEMRVAFNMCDCAARGPVAQDGRAVPAGGTDAGVDCVGGVCLTHGVP